MCKRFVPSLASATLILLAVTTAAAPPGPEPQVPEGGAAPGPFPNTSVSGVNIDAIGSTTFNSSVEITGFSGQGPIPWSVNRYNRGDIAVRLSPADPEAALGNLGQGFIEFADDTPGLAANQAWRPSPRLGIAIPTARVNGPVNWNDGEGDFYPTIALSESSSGPGYDMVTGGFGTGNLDINLGKAGTHASSPEANFPFSVAWFPYDQGWLGGEAAGPNFEGKSAWTHPDAHATGLSAGIVRWPEYPEGSFIYGGLAEVNLPGVSTSSGMLFAASSDGSSDVNILGAAPQEDGTGWLVAIREDSALDAVTLAGPEQSEFQFVYIPYDSPGLIGGYIGGADAAEIQSSGDFSITRTGAGTYELTIPGKAGTDGTLVLQAADLEPGLLPPLPTRAFLSYDYDAEAGTFVIQSRVAVSDTTADLRDTDFYFAWIDFETPLVPPAGPTLRSIAPVALSDEFTTMEEAALGINTHEPEVLVTSIDSFNTGGYSDPITGTFASSALVGWFVNPITLEKTRDAFVILGNPGGDFTRHDTVYNPFSKQYIVVANARSYGPNLMEVPLIAIVNPQSVAGENSPVAKAFVYDENTTQNYDDVAVAASAANGNFILAAEHDFEGEGEGVVGVLFDAEGNVLTENFGRLDTLQPQGDEDDPDVKYLPGLDAFLYTGNTDFAEGLANRVTGSIVQTVPDENGNLQVAPEQPLGTDRLGGVTEGHPASIESPFDGRIITVFDLGGNNVERGDISYVEVGPGPGYEFSQASPEIPYLDGVAGSGDPFKHNHPQIAVDPNSGVFLIGHNANQSAVGYPDAYVFTLLGPDGQPLPSQLGIPGFYADTPQGTGNGAILHNVKYSPMSDSFIVVFNTLAGTLSSATYVGSIAVTSNHLDGNGEAPSLLAVTSGSDILLSWPDTATGFVLQSTSDLTAPEWTDVSGSPTQNGGRLEMTVSPSGPTQFFRLVRE